MAYREFHTEKHYEAPDVPGFLDKYSDSVSSLFDSIYQKQKDDRDIASKFNYELKSGFESDQKILGELVKDVVNRATTTGGKLDIDTKKLMSNGKSFAEISNIQKTRAADLNKRIDDFSKNKYYDTTNDYKSLQRISDPEVNFQNRGAILDDVEKNIGSARHFKKSAYLADYVKDRQRSYKEKTTGSPDSKNTKYDQSTFWDDRTGKPGVTDEHAVDLLKSDPMLDEQYTLDLQDQLSEEISQMKASGDERSAWMKGKSDADIANEIINNPSRNFINQKPFGERKRDMAKSDLSKFNAIDSKVSYETKAGGGSGNISNDAIGHSDTYFNNKLSPDPSSLQTSSVGGPGGILMIKKGVSAGRPIQIEADSQNAFNLRTGKNAGRSKGKFNLTGYQLGLYDKNGKLYPVQGGNQDELIAAINNIPDEAFKNLEPELNVALNGYEVNEGKMLGDVATKAFQLSEEIGDEKDPEKRAQLESQLGQLNQLKSMFNASGFYDEDIIQAAQKSGIKQIRNDQLLRADRSDLDKIKTITGGLDLTKQDQWTPEMKTANDVYKQRWAKANSGKLSESDTERKFQKPEKKSQSKSVTKVASQADVDKLPKGAKFIWLDGNEYTKD